MTASSEPGKLVPGQGAGPGSLVVASTTAELAACAADRVPLHLEPGAGQGEPIAVGVPFRRGVVRDVANLALFCEDGAQLPCQCEPLARWPDGSLRWVLVDFLRREGLPARVEMRVELGGDAVGRTSPGRLQVEDRETSIAVDTGVARFVLGRETLCVEALSAGAGQKVAARLGCEMTGPRGSPLGAWVQGLETEARGPMRATFRSCGAFAPARGADFLEFQARWCFFAETGLIRLQLTVRNPHAAKHRGGLWDLGDPGSRLFEDLSLAVGILDGVAGSRVAWRAVSAEPLREAREGEVRIFQASSGGDHWKSRNHVNRDGQVPLAFRGYRVDAGGTVEQGLRASPVVLVETAALRVSVAVRRFWEQFPKAVGARQDGLRMGLFPREHGDLFELQGGEQKTHTVYLLVEPSAGRGEDPLAWVHSPSTIAVDPCYLAESRALGRFVPTADDPHGDYVDLVESGLSGPACFLRKRETIDEYGWRHFGDTPADHEDAYYSGPHPVISHYNNQYDLIYGLLLQFVRSGRKEWLELGSDLALHVADIDIYHTREDRPGYNGALPI